MKKKMSLLILTVMLCLAGCNSAEQASVLTTTISQIDTKVNGHIEQLKNYDSPYTICYKNKDDTYSMYIFSSPIQYKTESGDYCVIDNTVVKSDKKGFTFENKANNIKTYFPDTLSEPFRVEKGADYIESLNQIGIQKDFLMQSPKFTQICTETKSVQSCTREKIWI